MTSSKHPKQLAPGVPKPPSDLERNPGIGASKGAFARTGDDPETIEGDNTYEGDIENDTTASDGVNPGKLGRTNK